MLSSLYVFFLTCSNPSEGLYLRVRLVLSVPASPRPTKWWVEVLGKHTEAPNKYSRWPRTICDCFNVPVFKHKWYAQALFITYFLDQWFSVRSLDQQQLQARKFLGCTQTSWIRNSGHGDFQGMQLSTQFREQRSPEARRRHQQITAETEWCLNGRTEKNQDGRDLGCYFPRVPADPLQVVQSPPPVNLEQSLDYSPIEVHWHWDYSVSEKKVFKL